MGGVLKQVYNDLLNGKGITVKQHGPERKVRIEWLNLYNEPAILRDLVEVIYAEANRRRYGPDSILSVETSGAKYGVVASLRFNLPYVSIHRTSKIIFQDPVWVESVTQTEAARNSFRLYLDRAIMRLFKRPLFVDDIRRTSRTMSDSIRLAKECGAPIEACFVIFDFRFAGHPLSSEIPVERYHPLFIISELDDNGRCIIDDESLALNYM